MWQPVGGEAREEKRKARVKLAWFLKGTFGTFFDVLQRNFKYCSFISI